jgi:glycosyltransferase involved in cell wall biosynthesis
MIRGGAYKMELPSVSIIIPAHNSKETLPQCLGSIMGLDYPSDRMEIIVVNNRSTDDTEDIARRYPFKVLDEAKVLSAYAARNRGIRHASGDILVFTDTDCTVSRQWLRSLLSSHTESEIGCFAGKISSYQPKTLAECFADIDPENHDQFICVTKYSYAQTANVAYRKGVFESIGLFNSELNFSGDVDFTWRMLQHGKYRMKYEPDAVVHHKHRSSLRGLYRQHKEYGEGMAALIKIYPESCGSVFNFLKDVLRFSLTGVMSFPRNFYRYSRGQISKADLWNDFLKALCRGGLVVGRVRAQGRRNNGIISSLLILRYIFARLSLRIRTRLLS